VAHILVYALGISTLVGCTEGYGTTSVAMSGRITEYVPGSADTGTPIDGVEVCQFQSNNCSVTDASGEYELLVLKGRELEISYIKDGYGPVLVARRSGAEDFVGDAVLATDAVMTSFAGALDTPYPPAGTGYVSATTYRGPVSDGTTLAGATYSLTGSAGRSYYLDDTGAPDASLAETQDPGAGGFVEVAPVNVTLRVSGAANCTSADSWNAAGTNAFRLPIRNGFWTQSNVSCE
jgi:hypothetical protein